jgi:tRNA(fMet)-specific endonuclease VapC
MTDYIVDTNHVSTVVTENHPFRNRLIRQIQREDSFSIAAPVLTEMLYGIQMLPRAKQSMREWNNLSAMFGFYEITRPVAEHTATLQVDLRRRGWQVSTIDALIATVALHHDLILLTNDKDFSRIPGLRLENWVTITGDRDG